MAQTGAAVMVNFVDPAIGCPDSVIVAVTPLPPAFAALCVPAETVVRPRLQDFRNDVLAVVQPERDRDLDVAAGGDLYLLSDKFRGHSIVMYLCHYASGVEVACQYGAGD